MIRKQEIIDIALHKSEFYSIGFADEMFDANGWPFRQEIQQICFNNCMPRFFLFHIL